MVTAKDIEYRAAGTLFSTLIPKGTKVIPASNLPGDSQWWVENWEGMSEEAEGWARNYGFLLQRDEVI